MEADTDNKMGKIRTCAAFFLAAAATSLAATQSAAGRCGFPGERSSFHTYDRCDFTCAERPCMVVAIRTGVHFNIRGQAAQVKQVAESIRPHLTED